MTDFDENSLPALGIVANSSAAITISPIQRRFLLQATARHLLWQDGVKIAKQERVCRCLRHVIPGQTTVDCYYSPRVRKGHLKNLQTCDSVWVCSVCSSKISERRRVELSALIENSPYVNLLMSFTVSHGRGDDLVSLRDALMQAFSRFKSHWEWRRLRAEFGYVGDVRAQEVTYSILNGFHPHLHLLLFMDAHQFGDGFSEFEKLSKSLWLSCVEDVGLSASWQHGLDVRGADFAVAGYMTKLDTDAPKWGLEHELAKGVVKQGRSGNRGMLQLLFDYALRFDYDDCTHQQSGAAWAEYARVYKGKRHMEWSRHPDLRQLLGAAPEKSDAEVNAEVAEDSILLASLSLADWRLIVGNDARAELQEAVNSGDVQNVHNLIAALKGVAHV